MPDDDLTISTVTCGACGRTWVVTENEDAADSPSKRTSKGRVCSACGEAAVWHIGATKIEPNQG